MTRTVKAVLSVLAYGAEQHKLSRKRLTLVA